MFRQIGGVLLVIAFLAIQGCSQSTTRPEANKCPVHGTVTLDGQPMPEGIIYFKTIATGAVDVANIKDGKFEGKAQEGNRRVEISLVKPEVQESGPMKRQIDKELIPAKYNSAPTNTLKATVTAKGPNEFKFEITSK